jgi:hypothetical protein
MNDHLRFAGLSFDDFRRRALDPELSEHEKVGFPDAYRAGREHAILEDLLGKLPGLSERGRSVLEVGPGCSRLPRLLIELCAQHQHELLLVDSEEMLGLLPDAGHVKKLPGRYPDDCRSVLAPLQGRVDVVLAYSVAQYVFSEGNLFAFLDHALGLLAPGGDLLIGDVPNYSMRNRFLASAAGREHHRSYSGRSLPPEVEFGRLAPGEMDDAVVLALVSRARSAGFHAFLLPQARGLPMANRREDVLIRRP